VGTDMLEIMRLGSKFGIELIVVGALIWVVWYLIKHTVIELSKVISKLADNVDKIGTAIDKHAQDANMRGQFIKREHENLIEQHKEMIKTLGRINGYKED